MSDFQVRRDSSSNNIPTVGYNEGADAQDVLLFGIVQTTETLTTDGLGLVTLGYHPVSVSGEVTTDISGYKRGRNLNNDIIINSGNYYAGNVIAEDKTLKVYSDSARTSAVVGTSVIIQYYRRIPLAVDANGKIELPSLIDVNVTQSIDVDVNLKTSEITLPVKQYKEKVPITYKLEDSIASSSTNACTLSGGDASEDTYITSIVFYSDEETDWKAFWFKQGSTDMVDMYIPPKNSPMGQISFGDPGYKVDGGNTFAFCTGASWAPVRVHVMAYGYQWAEV